jgi:hypothetical protein
MIRTDRLLIKKYLKDANKERSERYHRKRGIRRGNFKGNKEGGTTCFCSLGFALHTCSTTRPRWRFLSKALAMQLGHAALNLSKQKLVREMVQVYDWL